MGLGKENPLKGNLQHSVSFQTTKFKPNVSGKPLAHRFPNPENHPNRTYLNETRETKFGDIIQLGDTIHVELEIPVVAIVNSIYRKPNGKTYITGVLRDESVETWISTIVQGPQPEHTQKPQKKPEPKHDDVKYYEPQQGRYTTWRVGDRIWRAGLFWTIKYFDREGHEMHAVMFNKTASISNAVTDLWKFMPPLNVDRWQGRTKMWFEGNHVQFGHGPDAEVWKIWNFVAI